MLAKFARWGMSLAIRSHGRLVMAPVEDVPVFDLDALVARITDANRHEEIAAGS
jgi:antitoxin component of MazEF toxin-antitoxin module